MKRKNSIKFILTSILALVLFACEDFLTIVPKDELTSETIFASEKGADLFVNRIYMCLPDYEGSNSFNFNQSIWDSFDWMSHYYVAKKKNATSYRRSQDRAITADTYTGPAGFYNHNYPSLPFHYGWVAPLIRNCNLFLESTEKYSKNYTEEWYTKRRAEVRVIRSFHYHFLWMVYGGVPLITEVLNKETMGDDIFRPSASHKELYEFMVSELEEAAKDLPNEVGKGHVTKGAALTLKAWIELYMGDIRKDPRPASIFPADPQFAQQCYKACATTCQQIMDLGVYRLFPTYNDMFMAVNNNNSESIWAYQHAASSNPSQRTLTYGPLASWFSGFFTGTCQPTQNLVEMYRMNNGLPITHPASGYNPQQPYKNREQRFYETVICDSSYFAGKRWTLEGANGDESLVRAGADAFSGYYRRKGIDPAVMGPNVSSEYSNYMFFRYAEVLLMYAEAKIKSGQVDASAINAIDQVRIRGGLPTLNNTYGVSALGMTKEELLNIVNNERVVELTFEHKSYWDLIRSRTAEIHLSKPVNGIRKDKLGKYTTVEVHKQIWPDNKFYLLPIYRGWLEKNPAWMDPNKQVDGRTAGQNPGF